MFRSAPGQSTRRNHTNVKFLRTVSWTFDLYTAMISFKMNKSPLKCALTILLITELIITANSNQSERHLATRYSLGAECQYIHSELLYTCAQGSGISVIPSPCCIPQVRHFRLVGNAITSLRKREFSRHFSNLNTIDLRNNRINRIHQGAFHGMTKLKTLDLSGNELTTLENWCFKGLTSLTTLNLGNNKITSLTQWVFNGLQGLTMLKLDNNNLNTLQEEVFELLRNLVNLQLNGNQLSNLETESFSGLRRLETLSLAKNRIQAIPAILDEMPSLTQLILSNNPIVCDCRVLPLRRWLVASGHNNGPDDGGILCAWPPKLRGRQLAIIDSRALCPLPHQPLTISPRTHSSTTQRPKPGQGIFSAGGSSKPGKEEAFHTVRIGQYPAGRTTVIPTVPTDRQMGSTIPSVGFPATLTAPAAEKTDWIFFDNVPDSPDVPPVPTSPMFSPHDPAITLTPHLGVDSGVATPNPRPTLQPEVPDGRPDVNGNPQFPGTGAAHPSSPASGGRPHHPSVSQRPPPGNPMVPTSGYLTTGHPNVTSNDTTGATRYPTQLDVVPGSPNPDSRITMPPSVTSNNSYQFTTRDGGLGSIDPVSNGGAGGSSSSVELPNTPPITYGVPGQSVVLLCDTDELVSKPRVKWMLPDGEFVKSVNSRFRVDEDGSLRIKPLQEGDVGSYRCIIRHRESSRVVLVRLRAACPCNSRSASMEEQFTEDLSPVPYPLPPFKCSWTPLVIAVVTTFQGTVVACAILFCVWYTRCYRRQTFKIHIEDAEKRDSKRLRNSDISVLRRCSNPTVSTSQLSSRPTSCDQESAVNADCNSLNPSAHGRTSHTLSDYMNTYVSQQMRRHRLPVPDYVDLDPESRDANDTLYSSLQRREFGNRRRRYVTE